jgi:hypothetical protein
MKIMNILVLLFVLLASPFLHAAKYESLFDPTRKADPKIFVNNRILAKVNGKSITTFDVMKKMDIAFLRQYPQYADSPPARAQYYDMSWKYVLEDLIDKELILIDAIEHKVEVSGGDVRQEMESSFGPNIIANLDKIGMTFDDAAKIIQDELILQRMMGARVHSKAFRSVTPAKIKEAYDLFIQDPANAELTQWTYQAITVKERNEQKSEETAKAALRYLKEGVSLDELPAKLKEEKILGRRGKVTISNEVKNNEKELSETYQEVLTPLDEGMYSEPFRFKSRQVGTVFRILYVKKKIPGGIPSFKDIESLLKEKLLNDAVGTETDLYIDKLRQHHHVRMPEIESSLPQNYQPFLLK